jgi:hypothetical protein
MRGCPNHKLPGRALIVASGQRCVAKWGIGMLGKIIAAGCGLFVSLGLAFPALAADPVVGHDPAGDWHGAIAGRLHVLVHIDRSAGGFTGTLTSVDQGGVVIPLTTVSASGDELGFTIALVAGRFTGKWDPSQNAWVGQWTQGASMPLTLASGPLPPPSPKPVVQGLDGTWEGLLVNKTGRRHVVLRVRTDAHGNGTFATVDAPELGAYGVALDDFRRDGRSVSFALKIRNEHYAGALSADGGAIAGSWTQAGDIDPLNFTRLSADPGYVLPLESGGPNWKTPSDAGIRAMLVDRIDRDHQGVGIVVGIIQPSGRRIIAYGRSDAGDPKPLDGDTEFEIGSMTKVFTALVLAWSSGARPS